MKLTAKLKGKLEKIESLLKNKRVIVAFSGGIDSTLLAFLSDLYAKETLLITASSSLFSDEDLQDAAQFSKTHNISHKILEIDPLMVQEFCDNPKDRCYICKNVIFSQFVDLQRELGYDMIIEGSNISDLGDYRPGYEAIKELGVKTPYIEARINKENIIKLSRYFDLEAQDKPANACFASRITYGISINETLLQKIKEAENFLKTQFKTEQVRVRFHEDDLVRIEFIEKDLFRILTKPNIKCIIEKFKKIGFKFITIDLEGYRKSGLIFMEK
ncbi:MAG: tRNA(Ile)-lysidine synthase [Promethearchaeota archaeon]|nr:MAG: tRNA(Ile)-lysidine synthase [Candidatus Lokiarchaeota archaeon]